MAGDEYSRARAATALGMTVQSRMANAMVARMMDMAMKSSHFLLE